jgi:hypothetical protein
VARAHGDDKHDKDNPTNDYSKKLLKQVGIDRSSMASAGQSHFRNESGKEVRLGQYLGDKPAMVLMCLMLARSCAPLSLRRSVYTLERFKFHAGQRVQFARCGYRSGRNTRDGQGQQGRVHEKV